MHGHLHASCAAGPVNDAYTFKSTFKDTVGDLRLALSLQSGELV